MYLHPGVYIEEIPSGSRPIEAASTSTALIVGFATKGPLNTPTLLFSFDQYVTQFGGIVDFHLPSSRPDPNLAVDYMGHTVRAFFNNGGSKAYIVRLAADSTAHPLVPARAKLVVPLGSDATPTNINSLTIEAVNQGAWANGLRFQADKMFGVTPTRYTISVGRTDSQNNFVPAEIFTDVSLDANDTQNQDYVGTKINGVSTLIKIKPPESISPTDSANMALMVGSFTSGPLDDPIAGLHGRRFAVKVDPGIGTDTVPVAFSATPPAATTTLSLSDIAGQIEAQVTGAAPPGTSPRAGFTCTVEGGRLVLRSGAQELTAAVTVTPDSAPADDAAAILNLIEDTSDDTAKAVTGEQAFLATLPKTSPVALTGGGDGILPDSGDYEALLPGLKKLRDISIILLPGQTWLDKDDANKALPRGIIDNFLGHAELMKNRMLIIDPDPKHTFTSSLSFTEQGFPASSTYAVTYYPWLEVANPHYHAELRPNRARTVPVPPSGFAAGLWARTDAGRGVWKAPAGLQAGLTGAANTKLKIGDDEQDQLNPVGVNCFRRIISDIVIWGSRTLATKANPEWRYVPVRRTAMMLEESIYQGIQWAVFEPNDHRLWSSLRLNIEAFMGTLFRSGAFQGEKASDAYFVRCNLGDTMTQAEIDAGQVIVLVGFAPLKPAEFVIVRIQQIVGKQ